MGTENKEESIIDTNKPFFGKPLVEDNTDEWSDNGLFEKKEFIKIEK